MRKINLDVVFKFVLLLIAIYILFITTNVYNLMRDKENLGRYQLSSDGYRILDTKTGVVYRASSSLQKIPE